MKRGTPGGLEGIITVLREIVPVAEEKDVLICLENHANDWLEGIDDYAAVLDAIDSPQVGICLDTGHFDAAGVDINALIDRFHPRINHIHVKENNGVGHVEFVRFGEGTTDNRHYVDRMLDLGYEGFITVELSPQKDQSTLFADVQTAYTLFKDYETA